MHLQIAEMNFLLGRASKHNNTGDHDTEHSELPPLADPESNVYSFGVLLLEIISGKLPYSEEQGPLVNWVGSYETRILHLVQRIRVGQVSDTLRTLIRYMILHNLIYFLFVIFIFGHTFSFRGRESVLVNSKL